MSVLTQEQAEVLEALTDQRIGALPDGAAPEGLVEELEAEGLLEPARREEVVGVLEGRAAGRPVQWGALTTTQGEVLAGFARLDGPFAMSGVGGGYVDGIDSSVGKELVVTVVTAGTCVLRDIRKVWRPACYRREPTCR